MKEIIDIVNAYEQSVMRGIKSALATVVSVEGSAYRRAGARMLITEDGQLTGAISGGCLEGDALRKARLVISQQSPMLVTYDTTDDDDAKLGVGLGCNGIINIFIEPVSATHNPIQLLKAIVNSRNAGVLVTLFFVDDRRAPQPGTRLCLTAEGVLVNGLLNSPYLDSLKADAAMVLERQQSSNEFYSHQVNYSGFLQYVKPVISLVIVGAGNDAIPLSRIAAVLGWDITVLDGRHNYALPERFPAAKKVIVSKPDAVPDHIAINGYTAFVLMTHNYNYELALLAKILPLNIPYIGVLGPRKKLERMLSELEMNGPSITEQQLAKVYGPTGLDIGSEGAEEIALSIVAEIKAVFSGRNGESLKYKQLPIHAKDY